MNNEPVLVGITGGIGAGKSTVSRIFALLGVPVYDADSRAKKLMTEDPQLVAAITAAFGEEAYHNGVLNRHFLAEKAFADDKLVARLNALVHPAVARDFAGWHNHHSTPYILKEAALLFETGAYQALDVTILVTCPQQTRMARIKQRDPQRPVAQIEHIMAKQIAVAKAEALADFIIKNDEENMLIPQVLTLDKQLRSIR